MRDVHQSNKIANKIIDYLAKISIENSNRKSYYQTFILFYFYCLIDINN